MTVRVKICGVTSPDDAAAAAAAGADMIGLNFHRQSRRYVEPSRAQDIARAIPDRVWRVGVFVNVSRSYIEELRRALVLSAIQLHGDEPAELLYGWPCPVIRAVRLHTERDARDALARFSPDYFLCEGRAGGGSGETFPWAWARALPAERLFVAGGLRPENVAEAVRVLRPFAVDVATGVESAPGRKDMVKMRELIENAKAA